MPKDREIEKIEKIQELFQKRLTEKRTETIFFSFEELDKEPLLVDRTGLEKILNLIHKESSDRISWKYWTEYRMLRGGGSAAHPDDPPGAVLSKIGIEVHVSDPSRLAQYFDAVFFRLNRINLNDRHTLIEKQNDGNYYYQGAKIEMPTDTLYYPIFDMLVMKSGPDGFLSYEEIERLLSLGGHGSSKNRDESKKRIQNAVSHKGQGLFRVAKVNGKELPTKTPKGEALIKVIRGRGLKLNNPIL